MISDAHVLTVKFHNTGDKEERVQTPGVEAEVLQRIKKIRNGIGFLNSITVS